MIKTNIMNTVEGLKKLGETIKQLQEENANLKQENKEIYYMWNQDREENQKLVDALEYCKNFMKLQRTIVFPDDKISEFDAMIKKYKTK